MLGWVKAGKPTVSQRTMTNATVDMATVAWPACACTEERVVLEAKPSFLSLPKIVFHVEQLSVNDPGVPGADD